MSEESVPLNVNIDPDEMQKVMKKYKKLKKYMKSSLFEIKKLDGNEEVISKLVEGVEDIMGTETKTDPQFHISEEKIPAKFLLPKVF